MQDIEIYIEELVLHGFEPGDYRGIKSAVEAELARLLKTGGIPFSITGASNIRTMEAGGFTLSKGTQVNNIGRQIAGTLYKGFKNQKSPVKK